ncbi:hypothetical protein SEA_YAGO84_82 [Gordonia phage Yago84]|nr:hypothetical protein SEA_YAGO84_82 [Gordonia phage Yago84]QIG59007.1 membrane protein [Gordonia phage AnClar]WIC90065.1 membrane protein [Gordonia phage Sisko]
MSWLQLAVIVAAALLGTVTLQLAPRDSFRELLGAAALGGALTAMIALPLMT